jgi:hypothetical protein
MSSDNPFSPTFHEPTPFSATPSNTEIRNVVPELGDIFQYAWNTWKYHLGLLVGATVIIFALFFMLGVISGFIGAALQQNGEPTPASSIFGTVFSIFNNLLSIFLGIGYLKLMLDLLRGKPTSISTLFSGGDRFLSILGFSILFGLMLFGGFLLLIVPGVIMLFRFWPAYYLVVDRSVPVMKSFGMAWEITRGNSANTFLLMLSAFGIGILGMLACGIGLFFSQPLALLLFCTAYLMMSGQLNARSVNPNPFSQPV